MHRDDDHFPFRQATRLVNEFQHGVSPIWLDLVDRQLDHMNVLLIIYRNALRPNAEACISMHALAASLGRPPETVRRHVRALSERGYCRPDGRTMYLAEDFLRRPEIVERSGRLVALFRRLLAGFEETGFLLPENIGAQAQRAMLVAALDIYLSVLELAEAPLGKSLDLYVIGAITVHNASAITHDRVLAERFGHADTVPPEALRRPLSVRALAAIDGLPYATIWRHVAAVERAGLVRRVPDGYLLSDACMRSAEISDLSRTKVRYVRRVLNDLANAR